MPNVSVIINQPLSFSRKFMDHFATFLCGLASLIVLIPLVAIFGYLIYRGGSGLSLDFFTKIPVPVGESGGGMANAIVGSLQILFMASLWGVPVGIGAGVYLAEYGHGALAKFVRFISDVLNGIPSIVIGIAAYSLFVLPFKHFSALSGAMALGMMMVPTIARTTEEMLLMVPRTLREAALGLGIPKWRTTLRITIPTAKSGIITGIMLAFARVAGETAPLLFTSFGNSFWNMDPRQPTAALPLQIFIYAISPYEEWHKKAWTGALVLVGIITITVSMVRFVTSRTRLKRA
jgi:phosphate transport system permease protein